MTGIAGAVQASSVDLVRKLTSVTRGGSFPIYAPWWSQIPNRHGVASPAQHPGRRVAMEDDHHRRGGGRQLGRHRSQLFPILSAKDRRELSGLDVVSEMCSILFNADGEPLTSPLTRERWRSRTWIWHASPR